MQAKLVVVGGKASKSEVTLRLPSVIGRSREVDLTVAHPTVSRRHCEIFESGGLLRIRDLGSLNGTFVRRERIQEMELRPDDEFTIGPLTFRVEYSARGRIAAPPTPAGGEGDSPEPDSFDEPAARREAEPAEQQAAAPGLDEPLGELPPVMEEELGLEA